MKLRYNEQQGATVNGVPARDLDADDLARAAARLGLSEEALIEALCVRGLYQSVREGRRPPVEPGAADEPPDAPEEDEE